MWFRIKRKQIIGNEDDRRIRELTELRNSIDKLLTEALEISSRLSGDVEKKRKLLLTFMEKLDREKDILNEFLNEYKALSSEKNIEQLKPSTPDSINRYSEAVRLAKTGLSVEEIASRVNIPIGEIELVLSLRK